MADLIHLDQDMYGMQNDPINMALRRYAGMALTNLTFGDVVNKVQTEQELWRFYQSCRDNLICRLTHLLPADLHPDTTQNIEFIDVW